MGVEWFDCDVCGESICDAGDFVSCECGRNWCDEDCANEDDYINYEREKLEPIEIDGYYVESSCKYCREEDFEDGALLEFVLEMFGSTRKTLIKGYKEYKRDKGE